MSESGGGPPPPAQISTSHIQDTLQIFGLIKTVDDNRAGDRKKRIEMLIKRTRKMTPSDRSMRATLLMVLAPFCVFPVNLPDLIRPLIIICKFIRKR